MLGAGPVACHHQLGGSTVKRQFDECQTCGEAAEDGVCLGCGLVEEDCECPPRDELEERPGE